MKDTVWLDEEKDLLMYIDQTKLPQNIEICSCDNIYDLHDVIKRLAIRGAPAIGVGAAIGLYAAAVRLGEQNVEEFLYSLDKFAEYLISSRPTAVNLSWAVNRMVKRAKAEQDGGVEHIKASLKQEALKIYNEDIQTCRNIGLYGEKLIPDGANILTHCNAGSLAAVRYGTALAPVYVAAEKGKKVAVYSDETRPLLQGARLTVFELAESGIDVTLQCDNMAASLMSQGKIDIVFVGADRVAENGDAANKIGTLGVAIIAKHYGIPFYVCAPFSTIDFDCKSGRDIVIEQRSPEEVTAMHYEKMMTHPNAKVYNPAFDVTPAELITGIITERGVFKPNELRNQK
ncbi:MAG: S-methyl-5-thioribose-1-phosphate isomerase [Clostridia bacterium]|nr:S-methyl-5-thioribose-1-phosphate isomerase [Clostridia bacterium]MBR6754403.1 S-methyl-5-thioribose-1-phosphate isomerase [Clostridia bacterium]